MKKYVQPKFSVAEASITEDLPLSVRIGLAQSWLTAVASELSLSGQPKDNLDEALWSIDFITDDLADVGTDAFRTLSLDLGYSLISAAASTALICPDCLANAIGWGEHNGDEEAG